jgi:predicted transcriptional regulator
MRLNQVIQKLNIKVLCGDVSDEKEVTWGYVSDLLSDVMGNAEEGNIWVTMQTHKNVVAVAVIKELSAILIVNGNRPDEESLFHANKEGVVVLSTTEPAFTIAGKIYNLLMENEKI